MSSLLALGRQVLGLEGLIFQSGFIPWTLAKGPGQSLWLVRIGLRDGQLQKLQYRALELRGP